MWPSPQCARVLGSRKIFTSFLPEILTCGAPLDRACLHGRHSLFWCGNDMWPFPQCTRVLGSRKIFTSFPAWHLTCGAPMDRACLHGRYSLFWRGNDMCTPQCSSARFKDIHFFSCLAFDIWIGHVSMEDVHFFGVAMTCAPLSAPVLGSRKIFTPFPAWHSAYLPDRHVFDDIHSFFRVVMTCGASSMCSSARFKKDIHFFSAWNSDMWRPLDRARFPGERFTPFFLRGNNMCAHPRCPRVTGFKEIFTLFLPGILTWFDPWIGTFLKTFTVFSRSNDMCAPQCSGTRFKKDIHFFSCLEF